MKQPDDGCGLFKHLHDEVPLLHLLHESRIDSRSFNSLIFILCRYGIHTCAWTSARTRSTSSTVTASPTKRDICGTWLRWTPHTEVSASPDRSVFCDSMIDSSSSHLTRSDLLGNRQYGKMLLGRPVFRLFGATQVCQTTNRSSDRAIVCSLRP